MKKQIPILVIAIISFVFYLVLTAGTGNIILWSAPELVVGLVFSVLTGIASKRILKKRHGADALSPGRWIKFLSYLPYLLVKIIQANMDVALRVLTGNINPGIIKIDSKQKNDVGVFMLANSITLTPGTLTVDVDNNKDLYVHCIDVPKEQTTESVCGKMAEKIRRIVK